MKTFTELKTSLTESASRYEKEYLKKAGLVSSGKSTNETVVLIKGYAVNIVQGKSEITHNGKVVSVINFGGGLYDDGYQLPDVRLFGNYEKIKNFETFDQLIKMITLGKTRQQMMWNKL